MTPKLKKIIARDGLVILGILGIGMILFLLGNITKPNNIISIRYKTNFGTWEIEANRQPTLQEAKVALSEKIGKSVSDINIIDSKEIYKYSDYLVFIGIFLMSCGYLLYLLIRFIIWAINTLKEK